MLLCTQETDLPCYVRTLQQHFMTFTRCLESDEDLPFTPYFACADS